MVAGSKPKLSRILVTGAAGAVGRRVVHLLLDRGYEVVAVDRPGASYSREMDESRVTIMSGDLALPAFCDDVVQGVDAVVSTAAFHDASASYDDLAAVNVEAVRRLYLAARRQGAAVFVHVSSSSVYRFTGRTLREDGPTETTTDYQRSRLDGERSIRELGDKASPAWVVLRPAILYGSGDRHVGGLLAALPVMVWALFGRSLWVRGGAKWSFVHAEDVAGAVRHVLERPETWRAVYNVSDDTPMTVGQALTAAFRAHRVGRSFLILLPSKWVIRRFLPFLDRDPVFGLVNFGLRWLWSMIRSRHELTDEFEPTVERFIAAYLGCDVVLDNRRLSDTGFELKHPDMRRAWPGVLDWYRKHRWLPGEERLESAEALALSFGLNLVGSHRLTGDEPVDRDVRFVLSVQVKNVLAWWKARSLALDGSCYLEHLAENVACTGRADLDLQARRIIVEVHFVTDEGIHAFGRGSARVTLKSIQDQKIPLVVYGPSGRELSRGSMLLKLPAEVIGILSSFRLSW
ncbi:MAG: NAD(P)-dependent oxidoreductase [Deltaproteobacteria bacterium]|nr:NAD(P)-dependent oxidoreductase [Deltaproteobacteria bacterium]